MRICDLSAVCRIAFYSIGTIKPSVYFEETLIIKTVPALKIFVTGDSVSGGIQVPVLCFRNFVYPLGLLSNIFQVLLGG